MQPHVFEELYKLTEACASPMEFLNHNPRHGKCIPGF
jgi:hypothetical protein